MTKVCLIYSSKKDAIRFMDAVNSPGMKDKFVTKPKVESGQKDIGSRVLAASQLFGNIVPGRTKPKPTETVIEQTKTGLKVELNANNNLKGTMYDLLSQLKKSNFSLQDLVCETDDKSIENAFNLIKEVYLMEDMTIQRLARIASSETMTDTELSSLHETTLSQLKQLTFGFQNLMRAPDDKSIENALNLIKEYLKAGEQIVPSEKTATDTELSSLPPSTKSSIEEEREEDEELKVASMPEVKHQTAIIEQPPMMVEEKMDAHQVATSTLPRTDKKVEDKQVDVHTTQPDDAPVSFAELRRRAAQTFQMSQAPKKDVKKSDAGIEEQKFGKPELPARPIKPNRAKGELTEKKVTATPALDNSGELSAVAFKWNSDSSADTRKFRMAFKSKLGDYLQETESTDSVMIDKRVTPDIFYDALSAVKAAFQKVGFPPTIDPSIEVDLQNVIFETSDPNPATNPLIRHFETARECIIHDRPRPEVAEEPKEEVVKEEAPKVKKKLSPSAVAGPSMSELQANMAKFKQRREQKDDIVDSSYKPK